MKVFSLLSHSPCFIQSYIAADIFSPLAYFGYAYRCSVSTRLWRFGVLTFKNWLLNFWRNKQVSIARYFYIYSVTVCTTDKRRSQYISCLPPAMDLKQPIERSPQSHKINPFVFELENHATGENIPLARKSESGTLIE